MHWLCVCITNWLQVIIKLHHKVVISWNKLNFYLLTLLHIRIIIIIAVSKVYKSYFIFQNKSIRIYYFGKSLDCVITDLKAFTYNRKTKWWLTNLKDIFTLLYLNFGDFIDKNRVYVFRLPLMPLYFNSIK